VVVAVWSYLKAREPWAGFSLKGPVTCTFLLLLTFVFGDSGDGTEGSAMLGKHCTTEPHSSLLQSFQDCPAAMSF
jgi:hypothetical protein